MQVFTDRAANRCHEYLSHSGWLGAEFHQRFVAKFAITVESSSKGLLWVGKASRDSIDRPFFLHGSIYSALRGVIPVPPQEQCQNRCCAEKRTPGEASTQRATKGAVAAARGARLFIACSFPRSHIVAAKMGW
jgi:hypothetical protein